MEYVISFSGLMRRNNKMNVATTIARNSAFSFLANLIIKGTNTLVFVLIARHLTVEKVGVYSLAMTYSAIALQFASWGLDQLLIREVARRREETGRYLVNFLLIRLLLSLLTYALLTFIVTSVVHYEPDTVTVLLLVGLTIVFDSVSNICQAVFIAFERLVYITWASLLMSLFKLAATWVGLRTTGGLRMLVSVIVGASLVGMVFNLGVTRWRFIKDRGRGRIETSAWTTWLRQTFPFIFIILFYTLDYQLDVVLLSVWQDKKAVGLYGAATTVLFALLFIPQALREAIFPAMSRLYPSNPKALRQLYSASTRWLLAAALPIAVGSTLIAGDLMSLVYRETFRESGRVLQIIVWSLLFLFINVPNNRLLIAAGKQRELAWFAIVSTSTNLLLNLLLIPKHSYMGAALARLASATVFFSLTYTYTYRRLIHFNLLSIFPRLVIASAVMGVLVGLAASFSLSLPLTIVIGGVSYGLTLWLVGFLSYDERTFIKQMLCRWRARRWAG